MSEITEEVRVPTPDEVLNSVEANEKKEARKALIRLGGWGLAIAAGVFVFFVLSDVTSGIITSAVIATATSS